MEIFKTVKMLLSPKVSDYTLEFESEVLSKASAKINNINPFKKTS